MILVRAEMQEEEAGASDGGDGERDARDGCGGRDGHKRCQD